MVNNWLFDDNYDKALNGRTWVSWDKSVRNFRKTEWSDQLIHGVMMNSSGEDIFSVTIVHGHK